MYVSVGSWKKSPECEIEYEKAEDQKIKEYFS